MTDLTNTELAAEIKKLDSELSRLAAAARVAGSLVRSNTNVTQADREALASLKEATIQRQKELSERQSQLRKRHSTPVSSSREKMRFSLDSGQVFCGDPDDYGDYVELPFLQLLDIFQQLTNGATSVEVDSCWVFDQNTYLEMRAFLTQLSEKNLAANLELPEFNLEAWQQRVSGFASELELAEKATEEAFDVWCELYEKRIISEALETILKQPVSGESMFAVTSADVADANAKHHAASQELDVIVERQSQVYDDAAHAYVMHER